MAVLDKLSGIVIGLMETFFYKWGKFVARRPVAVILVSFLIVMLCALGNLKLKFEADANRMWIPAESPYLPHKKWIEENFKGDGQRLQVVIFRSRNNVMTADNVREMFKLHKKVDALQSYNLTFKDFCHKLPIADIFLDRRRRRRKRETAADNSTDVDLYDYDYSYDEDDDVNSDAAATSFEDYYDTIGVDYSEGHDYNNFENLGNTERFDQSQKDISYTLPPTVYCNLIKTLKTKCFETSILEIWKYHEKTIEKLTDDDVINAVHVLKRSPYFGFGTRYTSKMGSIMRNETHVIGAKAMMHIWTTTVDKSKVVEQSLYKLNIDEDADEINLQWELDVIKLVQEQNEEWRRAGVDLNAVVNVQRSFSDVSSSAVFVDAVKMVGGYLLMFAYTTLFLGKLNVIELRLLLACFGLFAVLMGLGVAIGLMSLIGLPYIPLHAMLPFVCLGIGIDDMFVIVQCYNNLDPKKVAGLSVEERIGLTMKHAGVAITVTSLTDIFAFGIGALTILPGLEAFCVSAAIGIGAIYLLQSSWFIAWFTIDQVRIEARRNAIFPMCIKHGEDWKPLECSQKNRGQSTIKKLVKVLDFQWFKAIILLVTLGMFSVGLYGTLNMVIEFDPTKLLPEKTYLSDWITVHNREYPKNGWEAYIYFEELNPQDDLEKIDNMAFDLGKLELLKGVSSWFSEFKIFIEEKHDIRDWRKTIRYDKNGYNPKNFSMLLSEFMFSGRGAKQKLNMVFEGELVCNKPAPKVLASRIKITYVRFKGPEEHVPGKQAVEGIIRKYNATAKSFSHSSIYAAWETDEVIGKELWRNLGLAMACVALITLLLLADFVICFMVLICIVLTLVDLVGFLHFWDITIDTLSCVNIVLAVGLCVDYSAHIAHAFIVSQGTRIERAKNALVTMGPAIANGGITTFLALLLLGFSESHIFITFFKVFLLTVVFGLFHGLVFLTTVLSLVGPTSGHQPTSPMTKEQHRTIPEAAADTAEDQVRS